MLATYAKVVDIPSFKLRIIITESPGKNPSEFQANTPGKYILDTPCDIMIVMPITDLAHSGCA